MPLALVTGASVGIGQEIARDLARRGHDLVITARRGDALKALKKELEAAYAITVNTVALDLADPAGPAKLEAFTTKQGLQVDILVNNAGFGGAGAFHRQDLETALGMVQVNITALTELTRRFLPGMVERGHGRILNVASTAGFLPGPYNAVYFATKAYVLSFTEALAGELRKKGVTVTALCPGPVNTEFAQVAGLHKSRIFRLAPGPRPVARFGVKAMLRGRVVAVHTVPLKIGMPLLRLLPRFLVRWAGRKAMA